MGLFDSFRRRRRQGGHDSDPSITQPVQAMGGNNAVVGAKDDLDEHIQGFNNSNITFSGNLKGYDYDDI